MTATLWPWLVLAGLGVLHGLHPASGWAFAACAGPLRRSAWLWRLGGPLVLGHGVSVGLMSGLAQQGRLLDGTAAQRLAGGLMLLAAAAAAVSSASASASASGPGPGPGPGWPRFDTAAAMPVRRLRAAVLALWQALVSALMACAHGSGLMLVPALLPLCLAGTPAREITATGSLGLALAAWGLHLAMLVLTASPLAHAAGRWLSRCRAGRLRLLQRRGGVALLVLTGAGLILGA